MREKYPFVVFMDMCKCIETERFEIEVSEDRSMKEVVLCAANSYEKKYYLNPDFQALPESIRQELQIMCVLYTEDIGGLFMVVYDEEGHLELKVDHEDDDFAFDEIGSILKIKELQRTKEELFESLELYYKVFYLGETPDAELAKKAAEIEE